MNYGFHRESRQSNHASSDSGRTARFGDGSPAGEECFAAPTLIEGAREEADLALEDLVEGPEFAESYVIADAVMRSMAASRHPERRELRDRQNHEYNPDHIPREVLQISDRSTPGTPSS